MYGKIDRYLLIALVIIAAVILYFVIANKKDTNSQSDLLVAMARRLGATEQPEEKQYETEEEQLIPNEEENHLIVSAAEKLYHGKALTAEEKKVQKKFPQDVEAELTFSRQLYSMIDKFVSGSKDFTPEEKAFYEANSQFIDAAVAERMQSSQPLPSTTLVATVTEKEEAEAPDHNPENERANPPLSQEERRKLILSFFNDGVPKSIAELTQIYANATNTRPSKGNVSNIFGKLEGQYLASQEILHDGRWKVFYGLPEWFEGKKLKKEIKEKLFI